MATDMYAETAGDSPAFHSYKLLRSLIDIETFIYYKSHNGVNVYDLHRVKHTLVVMRYLNQKLTDH